MKNRNIFKLVLFILSIFSFTEIDVYAIPPISLIEGKNVEAIVTEDECERDDIGIPEIKCFSSSEAIPCKVNGEIKFFKAYEEVGKSYKNNVATLQLYSLFGNGDLIAKSEFCDILCKDGEMVHGILMDHALGKDYIDLISAVRELHDRSQKTVPVEVAKRVQQKYYNLIWLDLLALQNDRQLCNMFFEYTITGKNIHLIDIQGIDNDNAFSSFDSKNNFNKLFYGSSIEQTAPLPVFEYIDADLYKRFMTISEKEIADSISGILNIAQVEETIARFRTLQGYLLANKDIKIITPKAWNEETLEVLKRSHDNKRYFGGLLLYDIMDQTKPIAM